MLLHNASGPQGGTPLKALRGGGRGWTGCSPSLKPPPAPAPAGSSVHSASSLHRGTIIGTRKTKEGKERGSVKR